MTSKGCLGARARGERVQMTLEAAVGDVDARIGRLRGREVSQATSVKTAEEARWSGTVLV